MNILLVKQLFHSQLHCEFIEKKLLFDNYLRNINLICKYLQMTDRSESSERRSDLHADLVCVGFFSAVDKVLRGAVKGSTVKREIQKPGANEFHWTLQTSLTERMSTRRRISCLREKYARSFGFLFSA